MTPQQLIDMRGAGSAEKWLRKNGEWNDEKILDGVTKYKITVKVSGYYEPETEDQYFDVIASSADEAKDMAENLSDFDEIEDCEIDSIQEVNE